MLRQMYVYGLHQFKDASKCSSRVEIVVHVRSEAFAGGLNGFAKSFVGIA